MPARSEARKLPPEFGDKVKAVVALIPEGHLATYGQIAMLAGFAGRPRQVGMVLKGLPPDNDLPWHRVVNAQGYIPSRGRWWGAEEQARRLSEEGIAVDRAGNVDLFTHRWHPVIP